MNCVPLWALGYWGFHVGDSDVVHWILGIGTPAAAALLWGSFVSPKARYQVPAPVRLMVEFDVFAPRSPSTSPTRRF